MKEAESTYRRTRLDRYEAEVLQEIISGADLEHVLLESGTSSFDVEQVQMPDLCLNRGRYSFPVRVRGQFPAGRLCIGMVDRMKVPTWINGYQVGGSNLQVYTEDSELFYRAGPEAAWASISVSRESLQGAALRHLGHPVEIPATGVINLCPSKESLEWLKRTVAIHLETSRAGGRVRQVTAEGNRVLLDACAAAIASASSEKSEPWQSVILRADALMRRHIGDHYSSDFLCRSLGVSERTLQLYFSRVLGLSPKAWFQRLALHRARTLLTRAEPRPGMVAEVALQCGFDHFGRFSVGYRELFGDSPSSSLGSALVIPEV